MNAHALELMIYGVKKFTSFYQLVCEKYFDTIDQSNFENSIMKIAEYKNQQNLSAYFLGIVDYIELSIGLDVVQGDIATSEDGLTYRQVFRGMICKQLDNMLDKGVSTPILIPEFFKDESKKEFYEYTDSQKLSYAFGRSNSDTFFNGDTPIKNLKGDTFYVNYEGCNPSHIESVINYEAKVDNFKEEDEEIEYQNIPPNHEKDDWYDIKYSEEEQDRIKNEKKVYEKKATEDDIISLFDDTLDDEDLPF